MCLPTSASATDDLSRRSVLRGAVRSAGLFAAGGLLTACDNAQQPSVKADSVLRIGFVSPITGSASAFGEPNAFLLDKLRTTLKGGMQKGLKRYSIEIIDRDSKSDPQTAARVATDLVKNKNVDLMLATSTPETVNPVADVCEAAKVPCLSTAVPWEAWYYGRGGTREKPFTYTYHFFVGMDELHAAYTSLWSNDTVSTNSRVGVLWPGDSDGNAVRQGLTPLLTSSGFEVVDPGAYKDGTSDFSTQIAAFKKADADIFNAFPLPPDFARFWRQAREQGYRPRIASLAKTGLIPSQIEALGSLGNGLTAGFWWSPKFPYTSTLTNETAQQLADAYERSSGKQWAQIIGSNMALFEVAITALRATIDPKDRLELAQALGRVRLTSIVGPLDFRHGPMINLSMEPLVMAQWRAKADGRRFEPVIVDNRNFREIPLGGELQPLV